jgi:hypothetical protein
MGDMRPRSWTEKELRQAVKTSLSIRQVLKKLNLRMAGGNYTQVKKFIKNLKIDDSHLKGKGWSRGLIGIGKPRIALNKVLVKNSYFQSFKLKKRLFKEGIKHPKCEECGWAKKSADGRIPLELDHINGNSRDNRLVNLRILCPNCHSLKPTHRGRNRMRNGN